MHRGRLFVVKNGIFMLYHQHITILNTADVNQYLTDMYLIAYIFNMSSLSKKEMFFSVPIPGVLPCTLRASFLLFKFDPVKFVCGEYVCKLIYGNNHLKHVLHCHTVRDTYHGYPQLVLHFHES